MTASYTWTVEDIKPGVMTSYDSDGVPRWMLCTDIFTCGWFIVSIPTPDETKFLGNSETEVAMYLTDNDHIKREWHLEIVKDEDGMESPKCLAKHLKQLMKEQGVKL